MLGVNGDGTRREAFWRRESSRVRIFFPSLTGLTYTEWKERGLLHILVDSGTEEGTFDRVTASHGNEGESMSRTRESTREPTGKSCVTGE